MKKVFWKIFWFCHSVGGGPWCRGEWRPLRLASRPAPRLFNWHVLKHLTTAVDGKVFKKILIVLKVLQSLTAILWDVKGDLKECYRPYSVNIRKRQLLHSSPNLSWCVIGPTFLKLDPNKVRNRPLPILASLNLAYDVTKKKPRLKNSRY